MFRLRRRVWQIDWQMDWYIFPFWGASVSLYIVGIQRVVAMLADMVDIFAKHFFIMFAKHHFIIEWCLADKILPQNAQIGTERKDLVLGYKSNYKRIILVQNTPPIVKDL